MDLMKEINNLNKHNKESFAINLSTGYTLEAFKISEKEKSYGLFIGKDGDNTTRKVGLIRNVGLLKKALGIKYEA